MYFAAAISGGRALQPVYQRMVSYLTSLGVKVLTEHVGSPDVLESESHLSAEQIVERDMALLERCDGLIAEVSRASLGVGFEIATALHWEKPVLCLCEESVFLTRIITGNRDKHLMLAYYRADDDWQIAIAGFLEKVASSLPTLRNSLHS